ncbi:MAG TPA: O-antigen ligase family protein [Candidatus Sulfotelmatobacter sp.]|jgi:exopolysaccharide production protein ExoQ|nr:O-antigen ligase family protein [Candidatus Sulfotelmatobacter sp.]
MSSSIAIIVYLGVLAWLFRRDIRERPNITGAVWLVFFWVVISGGRFVTEWLDIFGLNLGGSSAEEGSPVDALFFMSVIGGGMLVLYRRRVNWGLFIKQNPFIALYLGYCLLACFWSDIPVASVKRWFKLFGQPVMVLVILTEPDPLESFTRLMKRCAYFIVVLSVLFIKYFPQYGRAFDPWTGLGMNVGMTTNKNTLGADCFILSLFFIWHILRVWQSDRDAAYRRREFCLSGIMLVLLLWLLRVAHSATSIGALAVALSMIFFVGLKFVNRRQIWIYLLVALVLLGIGEITFDLHKVALEVLGRNATLTDRTLIWQVLLHWNVDPLIGMGFEGFWVQSRMEDIAVMLHGLHINEAHNGYLETYLNLGGIGLALTLAMVAAAYLKAQRDLTLNFHYGRFRLAYLAAFLVYNWTEAAFRTHCVPFFIFFLIAIDYPRLESEPLPEWQPASVHKPDNLSPNDSVI